jgi:hypothetical protein
MTPQQLELMFGYISNENAISALRSVGMSWKVEDANRGSFIKALRKSVKESETIITKPEITETKSDSPSPHDDPDNKFSPLMIDMLMFVRHSGHRFHTYPNVESVSQQAAYHWFLYNNYFSFELVGHKFDVKLTYKGQALVDKILNTEV